MAYTSSYTDSDATFDRCLDIVLTIKRSFEEHNTNSRIMQVCGSVFLAFSLFSFL